MTENIEPRWTHEFRLYAHEVARGFFRHRDPQLWLDDVLRGADMVHGEASAFFDNQGDLIINVEGPSRTLSFVCVLLNQHAGQSPDDPTPEERALALEETMRKPPRITCPPCGEMRWQVDCDVTNRAAVMIEDKPRVFVDRAGPEDSTKLGTVGAISCQACGYTVELDGAAGKAIIAAAEKVLAEYDTPWRVITDYREF